MKAPSFGFPGSLRRPPRKQLTFHVLGGPSELFAQADDLVNLVFG
jgi:hypothetical protein